MADEAQTPPAFDLDSLLELIDAELLGVDVQYTDRRGRLLHATRINLRMAIAAHALFSKPDFAAFVFRPPHNPPPGLPPTSGLGVILAAIERLGKQMTDLTQAEADEGAAVNAALAEFKTLSGELTTLAAELKAALAANDPAATQAAAAQFEASAKALSAAVAAAQAADPNNPPPATLTIAPTSISGTAGTAVSGQFTATDAAGDKAAGTWSFQETPPDITFNSDGSFSGTPGVEAGDIKVVFTPADGSAAVDADATYSITAAAGG
jgi:hypothetical protein